jgi:hypothetical protein
MIPRPFAEPCMPVASPRTARRRIDSSERLERHRRVVERSFSWLLGCRCLGVRYERQADFLQSLLNLARALLCLRYLAPVGG